MEAGRALGKCPGLRAAQQEEAHRVVVELTGSRPPLSTERSPTHTSSATNDTSVSPLEPQILHVRNGEDHCTNFMGMT